MQATVNLLIFDYSGTLSLEAPRFGQRDNLVQALVESGLFAFGITTPEIFWDKIVNPTWIQGSTTTVGYIRVLVERIEELGLASGTAPAEIMAAASRFVESYLDHSRIDPLWRPLLAKLADFPGTAVIIATDHYAEATEAINRYLRSWDIPAQKAGKEAGLRLPIIIANSADIGFWKEDRRFWEALKSRHLSEPVRSVLIVDDFGFNEGEGDSYAAWTRIEARQAKTSVVLGEVFRSGVEIIPFFLKEDARGEATALRIVETAERIGRFLGFEDGTKNV